LEKKKDEDDEDEEDGVINEVAVDSKKDGEVIEDA